MPRRSMRIGLVVRLARGCVCFFFQAEDGIRDYKVTGVQTCALPILALTAEGCTADGLPCVVRGPQLRVGARTPAAGFLGLGERPVRVHGGVALRVHHGVVTDRGSVHYTVVVTVRLASVVVHGVVLAARNDGPLLPRT